MLMTITVTIFAIAYILIATEKVPHYLVTSVGAIAVLVIGAVDPVTALTDHHMGIDWNVILLLFGMMLLVGALQTTGLFEFLAALSADIARGNPRVTLLLILGISALTSTLLPNLTIVMLVAPVAISLARTLSVSPVPFVLATIIGSNVGGAATLIGDPPNLIIGSRIGIEFIPFLLVMGPIALIGLVVTALYFVFIYRHALPNRKVDRQRAIALDEKTILRNIPTLVTGLILLAVVVGSYIAGSLAGLPPAYVALIAGVLAAVVSRAPLANVVASVEWKTLAFFAGLFILVGALVSVGALRILSTWLISVVGTDVPTISLVLLGFSGLVSGIVDNIPYVTSMVPVVADMNTALGLAEPSVLWWALATGADFGGNLTIVGASANIVGVAIALREGVKISMWDFAKVGIPVTVLALAATVPYFLLVLV
jgi:Na+/H+ antiporter NhaD/arsenite permease-like protein